SDGGSRSSVAGRFCDGGAAACVKSATSPSRARVAGNGSSLVSILKSVQPSEKTSVRPSTDDPDAASGDMYPGDPITADSSVCATLYSPAARATPKSSTLMYASSRLP